MNLFKKILISLLSLTMCFAVVGMNDVKAASIYETESNDTNETANVALTENEYYGVIGGQDRNDYYKINVPKTMTVLIAVANYERLYDNGVYFYVDNLIYSNSKWFELDNGIYFTLVKLTAGEHYFHLYSYGNETQYGWYFEEWKPIAQKITNINSSYTITYKNPKSYAAYMYPKASAGGKLSYKSGNTKILTVDANGRIKTKAYGKTTITITAAVPTSNYNLANLFYTKGSKKVTITVKPKAVSKGTIYNYTKVKKKKKLLKKQLKVTWSRDKLATGYQVEIAKNKKFTSGKKSSLITKNSTTSKTFTKLKKGSKYYMRIRAYKTISGKKVYGPWSTTSKTIKVY